MSIIESIINSQPVTVQQLRKDGHKVEVTHRRRYFDPINKRWALLSAFERSQSAIPASVLPEIKGGTTTIFITIDGKDYSGISECSKKDAYIRKYGVIKALGRAIGSMATATTNDTITAATVTDTTADTTIDS